MKIIKSDYLLKNKYIISKLKSNQILKLVIKAEEPESFFTEELLGKTKFQDKNKLKKLIIETRKIDRFLNKQTIERLGLNKYYVVNLIEETGDIDKYLTPKKIEELELIYDIDELVRSTANPEKYLLEGQELNDETRFRMINIILTKDKENIDKYLTKDNIKKYNLGRTEDIIRLIKATENVDKYLIPEKLVELNLNEMNIDELVRSIEHPEKYLLEGQELNDETRFRMINIILTKDKGNVDEYLTKDNIKKYNLRTEDIIRLIKATGNIDKYLTPEKIMELKPEIYEIIQKLSQIDKFLLPGQKTKSRFDFKISNIIYATGKENIDKYLTLEYIGECTNEDITKLVKSLDNYEKYFLPNQQNETFSKYNCWFAHLNDDERDRITQLCKKNDAILENNTFEILDKKYIDLFGEKKVLIMSSYPDIVKKITIQDSTRLILIKKMIEIYENESQSTEWTLLFEKILNNIDQYQELIKTIDIEKIDNLDEETLQNLMLIIKDKNKLDIRDISQLEPGCFEKFIEDKMKEQINSNNKEEVLNAVFFSKFRLSKEEAEKIVEEYGEDIEKIHNEDLKSFVLMLKEVQNQDIETLRILFEKVESVKTINNFLIERSLKSEYMKLYNEKTLKFEKTVKNKELGENVYELPIDENGNIEDFGMIITSVSKNGKDYYSSWNQTTYKSQMFCASYIQRGMCGNVMNSLHWKGYKDIVYGFDYMPEDSLTFSSDCDSGTYSETFSPTSHLESRFLSPDKIIDRSGLGYSYNEINFNRFHDGERIQPSYIVVFRKKNEIENMDKAQEASTDFERHIGRKLPIVIVDLDKCLIAEKNYIKGLIEEYKENPSFELYQNIIQKRNNIVLSQAYDEKECDDFLKETEIEEKNIIMGKNKDLEKYNTKNSNEVNMLFRKLALMYKNKGISKIDLERSKKMIIQTMEEKEKEVEI